MMRIFLAGALAIYFGIAVMTAAIFHMAMPALNSLGLTYIGATWPAAAICNSTGWCDTTPPLRISKYFFTFDQKDQNHG